MSSVMPTTSELILIIHPANIESPVSAIPTISAIILTKRALLKALSVSPITFGVNLIDQALLIKVSVRFTVSAIARTIHDRLTALSRIDMLSAIILMIAATLNTFSIESRIPTVSTIILTDNALLIRLSANPTVSAINLIEYALNSLASVMPIVSAISLKEVARRGDDVPAPDMAFLARLFIGENQ